MVVSGEIGNLGITEKLIIYASTVEKSLNQATWKFVQRRISTN
jgi:hypothetical protein